MSDQEMTDCESRGLKPRLYGYEYKQDYKHKYDALKILSVATVCLLFGLIAGGYVQQFTSSIQMPYPAGPVAYEMPYEPSEADNFGAGVPGERPRRPNEEKCKARRCCRIRDDLSPRDLPSGLNCRQLDDEACGGNDAYCDWDCNPPANDRAKAAKRGRKRRFRGISGQNGVFRLPKPAQDAPGQDRYANCMKEGKLVSSDDCGVEYEEDLDPDERDLFCKHMPHASKKPDGPPGLDSDLSDISRRLVVLGQDDRTAVTSTSLPWSAVMYLAFTAKNDAGEEYSTHCTATMISPRWAITAAHCVYGGGDWYRNFRFHKNIVSTTQCPLSGGYNWLTMSTFSEWTSSEDMNHDIAWIQLASDPGLGDYFDIGFDDSMQAPRTFNIISYPGDKPDCTKWHQYCPYSGPFSADQLITTECDTAGGASGSGVYSYFSGNSRKRIIYSIHAKGSSWNRKNTAIRITASKFNSIKDCVTDNPNL